jgi:serine/threonine protein kinase
VLSLAADVARALLYLHHVAKPAVVHRDVKPANFLLDRAWRVKIADFGLAANSSKQVTGPGYRLACSLQNAANTVLQSTDARGCQAVEGMELHPGRHAVL